MAMTNTTQPAPESGIRDPRIAAALPAARTLAITTAVALLVATVILVTLVLPAEYGVDPLGTGKQLGLTAIANPSAGPAEAPPAGASAVTPVVEGPVGRYAATYKRNAVEFTLGPYEYVEYKYHLQAGATMLYSWSATAAVVHDLHGELNGDPNQVTSFNKSTREADHGVFAAPFTGLHGWYWENLGGETVTVRITTSGFYASAMEFRFDKTKVPHDVSIP